MDDEDPYRRRSAGKPALVLMRYGQEGHGAPFNAQNRWADGTLRLWLYPLLPHEPGTMPTTATRT